MEIMLQLAGTFIVGLIGVAVGFGIMKNQIKVNKNEIQELKKEWKEFGGNPGEQPLYIRRVECDQRSKNIQDEIQGIKHQLKDQGRDLNKVQNFVRWFLTDKEKISLSEVNKILNGGD